MNDAGFALAIAYTNLLAGLVYNGQPVVLYSLMAANNAVAPYLILGEWTGGNANDKTSFGQTGQITIQVVTRYAGNAWSKKPASDIADIITGRLKPTPATDALTVPGFHCWNTIIRQVGDLIQGTSTDTVIRKIITIEHSLQQR